MAYFWRFWQVASTKNLFFCIKSTSWTLRLVHPLCNNTTPNTVSERPSKLIVSVTFDDFYWFNQTCWCSIVGVFLIETHKIPKFTELFSKRFCIERLFYFLKIVWFSWDTVLVVLKKMCFIFWKRKIRNRNRCENSFYFFVFSVYAFEKHPFDDEKNWK